MSAISAPFERVADDPWAFVRRLAAGPAEGWLSLAAVAAMIIALGWSIDDAAWVLNRGSLTDFLPQVGLAGVAAGFIGAKVGWGRWRTHLVGSVLAGLIIPIVAGGIVLGSAAGGLDPAALSLRARTAADVASKVWQDLVVDGRPFTTQYGHFFLVFGGIMWGTGQFAAFAVFGHRRPIDAVVITGLILLANMSITLHDQLHLIVLFTVAGLFLLIRAHAFDEQVTWVRRKIGDPEAMGALYLRGGAVFITGAVLGSLLLTTAASSAPLQGLWRDFPQKVVDWTEFLRRVLPLGGDTRGTGATTFSGDAAIYGRWSSSNGIAFTARLPANETRKLYWRVAAYADFRGNSWVKGTTEAIQMDAGSDLLAGTSEDPTNAPGRREIKVRITPDGFREDLVVSPQTIESIDKRSTVQLIGDGAWFAQVESPELGGGYTVTASIPVLGDEVEGGLTENRLRAAGTDYPPEIRRLYLQKSQGAIGPKAAQILDDVRRLTPQNDPYDLALTMRDYFRDSTRFTYDTDVQAVMSQQCSGLSTVECFATIRRGYCQFYATSMAVLLREAGIPARFVQGFLPGSRSRDGTERVTLDKAHAWVEVFFPGYGWYVFDPTGAVGATGDTELPSGAPVVVTPRPSGASALPTGDERIPPSFRPRPSGGGAGPIGGGGSNIGPFAAIAALLLIAIAALAYAARRRAPRRPVHPDQAWRSLSGIARRLGYGPRPAQTVYEYAGALGDAVPDVRPQLATVARAKVEVAYGRQDLGDDRLRAIGDAYRTLRLALFRLAFRRRRPRPRRLK